MTLNRWFAVSIVASLLASHPAAADQGAGDDRGPVRHHDRSRDRGHHQVRRVRSPATIGGPGQTATVVVTSPTGVTVTVPPGSSPTPVTIAIGPAPAGTTVPAAVGSAIGPIVEIRPHGTRFALPVTVSMPIVPARVPPGATLAMAKAEPGGPWVIFPAVTRVGARLSASFTDFSTLAPVVANAAPVAPTVTAQPQAVTVIQGGSASFSVVADGTAPLAYQWSHDGIALAGATSSLLDLPVVTLADAGNYAVLVSNAAGSVTSAAALLTVNLPTFTVGGTVTGLAGAGLVLQQGVDLLPVAADGPFTFPTPIPDGSSYAVTVATQPTGQACAVTGGSGVATLVDVTSVSVTCVTLPVAPAILAQPAALTVLRGGSALFSVTASGTAPLAYQWLHDGIVIPGATLASYGLLAAGPADAGSYAVTVSNVAGSVVSAAAQLTVLIPAFTVGGTVTGLTGAGLVLQQGAEALSIAADGPFTFATPVADGLAYTVTIASQPTGQVCTVAGATGTVTGAAVTTVAVTCAAPLVAPSITTQPASLTVVTGASATFTVTASGSSPLAYQWSHDGVDIAGATAPILALASVTAADAGSYAVVVSNAAGSQVSAAAKLVVQAGLPMFTWMGGGTTHALSVGVSGTKGVADPANIPGARPYATSWSRPDGTMWLFGGFGSYGVNGLDLLNDLWKFDGVDWTWVNGESQSNPLGANYGAYRTPDPANVPGGRDSAVSWTDAAGNLWLFGGYGYDAGARAGLLNDLWRFDGTSWTWMSGSSGNGSFGAYGTLGLADPANTPGGRFSSATWTDRSGSLWLFGGNGIDYWTDAWGLFNDLWRFDGSNWAWMGGTSSSGRAGVYGTQGVAAATNWPGGRDDAVTWVDAAGHFWLFGGWGYDANGNSGTLNDLWVFDGAAWTWVSGSSTWGASGVRGLLGAADPASTPGARDSAVGWTDQAGHLWLFSGEADNPVSWNELSDLWMFDGTSWTWEGGPAAYDQPGVYGALGVAAPANVPGARYGAVSFVDSAGAAWIFGGMGRGADGADGTLNDLWRFH